jgi:predicted DNA-binding protein (MmcQ/YjbR family)
MFCVAGLDQVPVSASFKVRDDEFEEMSSREFFKPAAYVAKYQWVLISDITKMSKSDWKKYITQSYKLVRNKLPNKIEKEPGIAL